MKRVIIIFLVWMVVMNAFAMVAANRFNLEPDTAYTWIDPVETRHEHTDTIVSLHARWDSAWYMDIAQRGYTLEGKGAEHGLFNIVFFPLYPLILAMTAPLFAGNMVLAGWMASSLFLLLALRYFTKLIREFHPEIDPSLPVFLLLVFPTAFFLNAVYTESLFLFLSLATFFHGLKGEYGKAGIFGFCAALTRVTGVLLIIPLVWEYYRRHGFSLGAFRSQRAYALLAIPAATLGFLTFHWIKFGDFFLFLKVQEAWGRAFSIEYGHLVFSTHPAVANVALDIFFALTLIGATALVFRRLRTSYGLYMAATLATALSTGTLMSIGRYGLVLFPLFLLGGGIKSESARYAWIMASLLLCALYTILFVNHYWAG